MLHLVTLPEYGFMDEFVSLSSFSLASVEAGDDPEYQLLDSDHYFNGPLGSLCVVV